MSSDIGKTCKNLIVEYTSAISSIVTISAENKLLEVLRDVPLEPKDRLSNVEDLNRVIKKLQELSNKYKIVLVGCNRSISMLGADHKLHTIVKHDTHMRHTLIALLETKPHSGSFFDRTYMVYQEYALDGLIKKHMSESAIK